MKKLILKFMWNSKGGRVAKQFLKKNKVGNFYTDFKYSDQGDMILDQKKKKKIHQWNRMESPVTNSRI